MFRGTRWIQHFGLINVTQSFQTGGLNKRATGVSSWSFTSFSELYTGSLTLKTVNKTKQCMRLLFVLDLNNVQLNLMFMFSSDLNDGHASADVKPAENHWRNTHLHSRVSCAWEAAILCRSFWHGWWTGMALTAFSQQPSNQSSHQRLSWKRQSHDISIITSIHHTYIHLMYLKVSSFRLDWSNNCLNCEVRFKSAQKQPGIQFIAGRFILL